jgi:hypothetical protein
MSLNSCNSIKTFDFSTLYTTGRNIVWKALHRIFWLRGEVWVHKTSLTLPLLIEVSVPSQESERTYTWVLVESILTSFYDFSIVCWNCSDSVVFICFSFCHSTLVYAVQVWSNSIIFSWLVCYSQIYFVFLKCGQQWFNNMHNMNPYENEPHPMCILEYKYMSDCQND